MPTILKRIVVFCHDHNLPMPSTAERVILGKEIADYYFNNKKLFPFPFCRIPQTEETGTFQVISYPHCFTSTIDKFIDRHFNTNRQLPIKNPIKRRKRIPMNQKTIPYGTQ